jgi:hypothetical protein
MVEGYYFTRNWATYEFTAYTNPTWWGNGIWSKTCRSYQLVERIILGSDFDESCELHQNPKEHGIAMLGEREDAVAPVLGDSTVMLDDRLLG